MNDLPNMPALATEKQQASTPPVCPMHVFAELGTYKRISDMREVHSSTASCARSADGVVCEKQDDGRAAAGEQA